MSRAEGADVSRSGKSCSTLHSHSFVAKTLRKIEKGGKKSCFSMDCEFLVLTQKNKGKINIVG